MAVVALTHLPSPSLAAGERTYLARVPIDLNLALRQHAAYRRVLEGCGCAVRVLEVNGEQPDGVFVEDTAVVLDEAAVLASMGTASRRPEPERMEPVLREYRDVYRVGPPATLEGGDVLRVGRTLLAGLTGRTNAAGIEGLASLARPFGYEVRAVRVRGCLHLKSACTALPDGRLLGNPDWLELADLKGFEFVPVPASEAEAANVLLVGETVVTDAAYPETASLVEGLGFEVRTVDLSEFRKAEGAVTCLSLLLPDGQSQTILHN